MTDPSPGADAFGSESKYERAPTLGDGELGRVLRGEETSSLSTNEERVGWAACRSSRTPDSERNDLSWNESDDVEVCPRVDSGCAAGEAWLGTGGVAAGDCAGADEVDEVKVRFENKDGLFPLLCCDESASEGRVCCRRGWCPPVLLLLLPAGPDADVLRPPPPPLVEMVAGRGRAGTV